MGSKEWSGLDEWLNDCPVPRNEMNNLVMDYLITEGYKDAAEKFREEAGVEFPSCENTDRLDQRIIIRDTILQGKILSAIDLLNSLHPELLDEKRTLHFHLLQQELIEIIRAGRVEGALVFAQEHLAEKGSDSTESLRELERTLALLAFEKPETSPFADLLDLSHRQTVASEANAAILEAEFRNSFPRLQGLVQLVLWSQDQLDKRNITYPKITDVGNATIEFPKAKTN